MIETVEIKRCICGREPQLEMLKTEREIFLVQCLCGKYSRGHRNRIKAIQIWNDLITKSEITLQGNARIGIKSKII